MRDDECVGFLQWALPRLHMRWPGFRKVRRQVCKRIDRRMRELNVDGVAAYRAYLETHPEEWEPLDGLSRITISRFYRDRAVFAFLAQEVFPALVGQANARGEDCLRVWSAGCGCGEEPYTIALMWIWQLQARFPGTGLRIQATDADPGMIRRAKQACYRYSSIKDLPARWRERAFAVQEELHCLKPEYRRGVRLLEQDLRREAPAGRFDLVSCRNLAFTYFDADLQRLVLDRIRGRLRAGGALVLGIHEGLPEGGKGLRLWSGRLRVYRQSDDVG